jgi:polysaccharide biosynthesis transport protein
MIASTPSASPEQLVPLQNRLRTGAQPTPSSLLEIAWRHRWIVTGSTLAFATATLVYVLLATPLYTAQSRLFVEQIAPRILDNTATTDPGRSENFLYTQAELIKSTPVMEKAVEAICRNSPQAFDDCLSPLLFLKKSLEVSVGRKDNLISVSLALADRQRAVLIVKSVVDAYVSKYAEQKRSTSLEVVKILSKEKVKRDTEREGLRRQVDAFHKENPILSLSDERGNLRTSRCTQLASDLTKAELELLQTKEKVALLTKMRADPPRRSKLLEAATAQGTIKLDEFLRQQIHTLELALATESEKYDEGHPKVKVLKRSLEEMRTRAIQQESEKLEAYLDGIQQELSQQTELAKSKVDKLQHDYDAQLDLAMKAMQKAAEYPFLKDDLERTEKRCDLVIDRIMDFSAAQDVGALSITVMEPAEAGEKPTHPKIAINLGLGAFAGLLFGFGLALLRDFRDDRLRSADEITGLLGLPLLGVLPKVRGKPMRSAIGRLVATDPRSEVAESFRTLRTAIDLGPSLNRPKIILVTSPSPADGKSTVASNLAIAMAHADQSVLLVEANFRKPTQQEVFGPLTQSGLVGVLAGQESLDAAVAKTEVLGLSVLPCGPIPPNPAEVVNRPAFRRTLEELSRRFDRIVIDAPPVMPFADARVLGTLCNITLLVLRAEKSTRRQSLEACHELSSVGANIQGVVVNGLPDGTDF